MTQEAAPDHIIFEKTKKTNSILIKGQKECSVQVWRESLLNLLELLACKSTRVSCSALSSISSLCVLQSSNWFNQYFWNECIYFRITV